MGLTWTWGFSGTGKLGLGLDNSKMILDWDLVSVLVGHLNQCILVSAPVPWILVWGFYYLLDNCQFIPQGPLHFSVNPSPIGNWEPWILPLKSYRRPHQSSPKYFKSQVVPLYLSSNKLTRWTALSRTWSSRRLSTNHPSLLKVEVPKCLDFRCKLNVP